MDKLAFIYADRWIYWKDVILCAAAAAGLALLLGALVRRKRVLALCILAAMAALGAWQLTGRELPAQQAAAECLEVPERVAGRAEAILAQAADSAMDAEKRYWIQPGTTVAPKPNRDLYGQTEDPAQLRELLRQAEKLLDGQSLYFSPDTPIVEGTQVHYYLDDTILAITWKEHLDGTVYTFSEVKVADPSQFRRYMTGGQYGSDILQITTDMAYSVNAVVASSGDFYQFRNAGVIVYEGKVCRVFKGADTCYVDRNGDLLFTRAFEQMTMEEAQQFVDDHAIQFSLAFGPVLVENGELQNVAGYGLGEIPDPYARAALCQMDTLHYLLVNASGGEGQGRFPNMFVFSERVAKTGCKMAYALDGGQTTAFAMDGELMNVVPLGFQREISDIIYFATAIPHS